LHLVRSIDFLHLLEGVLLLLGLDFGERIFFMKFLDLKISGHVVLLDLITLSLEHLVVLGTEVVSHLAGVTQKRLLVSRFLVLVDVVDVT
jgi:hypothetical protein